MPANTDAFSNEYVKDKDLLLPENDLTIGYGTEAIDMKEIPWSSDDPDEITLSKLVPRKYAMDPISGGKFLEVGEFNGLIKALSNRVPNSFWYTAGLPYNEKYSLDTGGYPIDVLISVLYCPVTGKLWVPREDTEIEVPDGLVLREYRALQQRLTLRSLVSNNTDSPLIRENLFKTWEIVDGRQFGEIMKTAVMPAYTPPGYIDLSLEWGAKFKFKDYPRVGLYFKSTKNPCSHFKQLNDDEFTITNFGGLFERVYSKATTEDQPNPDPGRVFDEVQQDGMGIITGAVNMMAYSDTGSSSYGDAYNRCVSVRAFSPLPELPSQYQNKKEYAHLKNLKAQNAFKVMDIPTNYSLSSDDKRTRGIYSSGISDDLIKSSTGHTLVLDTSDHPKSAHETRPKNYCVRAFIKV